MLWTQSWGDGVKINLTAMAHRRKLEATELARLARYEQHLRKRAKRQLDDADLAARIRMEHTPCKHI